MKWVEYFYKIADQVKEKSKDKRTKIGAVIVGKDKEIVSTGYNSFPIQLSVPSVSRSVRRCIFEKCVKCIPK